MVQFVVLQTGMVSQGKAELGVHVVESQVLALVRTLDKEVHCTVAQQPDADIHEEEVSLHKASQLFNRRFLKHEVELIGGLAG